MGLIHSRASKKLAKAETELVELQIKAVRDQQDEVKRAEHAERVGTSVLRQPTMGAAIAQARRNRKAQR